MVSFRLSNKTGEPPPATLPGHLTSPWSLRWCSLGENVRDLLQPRRGGSYSGASCRSSFQVFSFFSSAKLGFERRGLIYCSLFVALWVLCRDSHFRPLVVTGGLQRRYCSKVRGRGISVKAGHRAEANTQILLSMLCWKLIIFGHQHILGKKWTFLYFYIDLNNWFFYDWFDIFLHRFKHRFLTLI